MTLKLNMLPPSVNNMCVRVFVRAAGLPFEEENVWGQTKSEEYLSKFPTGLTPSIETPELPKGGLSESCAVMMYLANREGLTDLEVVIQEILQDKIAIDYEGSGLAEPETV